MQPRTTRFSILVLPGKFPFAQISLLMNQNAFDVFFLFVFKFALWAAVLCLTCFKEVSAKVESIISYAVAIGPAPGKVSKESKCLKFSNFCRISTNSFIPTGACKCYIFFLPSRSNEGGGFAADHFCEFQIRSAGTKPRWQVIVLPILKQPKPGPLSRVGHNIFFEITADISYKRPSTTFLHI